MNAERAGRRAGHNLKLKAAARPLKSSFKLQASSFKRLKTDTKKG